MKNKYWLSSLAVLVLILSACAAGASVYPTDTTAPVSPSNTLAAAPTETLAPAGSTDTPTAVKSEEPAVVNVSQNTTLGSFLVDVKGMTLYLYTKDTPSTSTCYGACANYWPPLLTGGTPVAGQNVLNSLLGTTKRTDGTMQVTYNGWPLYYYASDKAPGDTTGENVQGVWFVITPAGAQK